MPPSSIRHYGTHTDNDIFICISRHCLTQTIFVTEVQHCGKTGLLCVLFRRDSCDSVSELFATDYSLRDLSEVLRHPYRNFRLSDISVILYLKVIVTHHSSVIKLFEQVTVYFTYALSLRLEIHLRITEMEMLSRIALHLALVSFVLLKVFM